MKTLLFLSAFLFSLQIIGAQSFERSLSAGYITSAELIKPYGTDQWLIAGRGEPEPGGYYLDTLFVAVMDQDGQLDLRKNLTLPIEEVHLWHDILALPDGGILACFESTLCDAAGYLTHLQRLDAQGNLVWEKNDSGVFGTNTLPDRWFLAPDGKLLGISYNEAWKLDPDNGNILWKADFQGIGDTSFYEIALIPDTENFIALGHPSFQKWKQTGSPNAPVYQLEGKLDMEGFRRSLTTGPNGTFYCWQAFPDNQLEKIDLNLQFQTLPAQLVQYGEKSMCVGEAGLYLTESSSNTFKCTRFDLDGQNPLSLLQPGNWLNPKTVTCNNGWMAIAGQDGSGLTSWPAYNTTCAGAWIRSVKESQPMSLNQTPNASVTAIQQGSTIDTVAMAGLPSGYDYDLSGGDFLIQVTNSGDIPIDALNLNVVFDFNQYYFICLNKPAKQLHFTQLGLLPGQSTWLNFGDIAAAGQAEPPVEICFWTSSPNELPDAVHEDDRFCQTLTYTVGVKSPEHESIVLSPNPADAYAELRFKEDMEGALWRLFDARGRLIETGICADHSMLQLNTSALPNGMYLLNLKNTTGKLVVQH